MTQQTAEAFARAADELREAAVSHKRTAAFHKTKAREAMAARQRLMDEAAALGLILIIEPAQPKEAKRND